jgi:hypothetical protein
MNTFTGHGANGPIPFTRCGPIELPAAQGFRGVYGEQFRPAPSLVFTVGGPAIGTMAPATMYLGPPFAPGQGGDTPGGGGAIPGLHDEVQTDWLVDGAVNPQAIAHPPGVTSWTSSPARRARA